MSASTSMDFVTKKVSRMSTRLKSRRSTITGSITSISKSCKLKRPTFKPWMSRPIAHESVSFPDVHEQLHNSVRSGHPCVKRPTFKRKKPVQRVPSIRDAFDEMCRSHIMDFVLVSSMWFHGHHIILYNFHGWKLRSKYFTSYVVFIKMYSRTYANDG